MKKTKMSAARRTGSAIAAAALAGCFTPAPLPTAPALEIGRVFAEFGDGGNAAMSGAKVVPVTYAERDGDALLHSLAAADKTMVARGLVGNRHGSRWAGVGFNVGANAQGRPVDLSGHHTLKIQLASSTTRRLRLRITGAEQRVLNSGCYPVTTLDVTPTLTEYRVPLRRFDPESYCGGDGRTVAEVIARIAAVEIVDTTQANKDTEFAVGRIEFLR